ncbi:hypothetical protein [Geomonas subterranea]|uniref:hypothetical protein n=1 Tax=Geomonas subterranea TaxID=2847989 RepID=UPI001CD783F1|nr:hypothetical protein [Geomonas fuzhouensis]
MENEVVAETSVASATPAAPAVPPAPQYVSVKVLYQAVVLVSLAMSILSVVVYDRFFTVKLASFDMLGYSEQIKGALAEKKITLAQADEMFKSVRKQIDSLPSKYVVISGDAILGNAPKVQKLDIR